MDDIERDKLHEDIRLFLWKLSGFDLLRVEYMGDMFIMDDKFLTDFSKAWGNVTTNDDNPANNGVREYIPQSVIDEAVAYQKKATSTSVDFGGSVHVIFDDKSDRVMISTGRGTAEFKRSQCAEIGKLLQSLAAPETVSPGSPTTVPGELIPKGIDRATWNGFTAQQKANYKRNEAGLEYALKMDSERHDAIIRQQQQEEYNRHNRW